AFIVTPEIEFFMHFVVKYFPEITIKSPPVRKRFIKQLARNLQRLLDMAETGAQVRHEWDRIDIALSEDNPEQRRRVADLLSRTPGIAYYAEAELVDFSTLEDLAQKVLEIWGPRLVDKSFCVR